MTTSWVLSRGIRVYVSLRLSPGLRHSRVRVWGWHLITESTSIRAVDQELVDDSELKRHWHQGWLRESIHEFLTYYYVKHSFQPNECYHWLIGNKLTLNWNVTLSKHWLIHLMPSQFSEYFLWPFEGEGGEGSILWEAWFRVSRPLHSIYPTQHLGTILKTHATWGGGGAKKTNLI